MDEKQMEKIAEAQNVVFEKVYMPAFFSKLAEFGIQPETEAEASEILEIAAKVKMAGAQPEQSPRESLLKTANAALDQILGSDSAMENVQSNLEVDTELKQALAALKAGQSE